MRFLFKRPRFDKISDELNTVQETLISEGYIFFDLIWYSIIFTLFLTSPLHPIGASIITFLIIYSTGCILYGLTVLILRRISLGSK